MECAKYVREREIRSLKWMIVRGRTKRSKKSVSQRKTVKRGGEKKKRKGRGKGVARRIPSLIKAPF